MAKKKGAKKRKLTASTSTQDVNSNASEPPEKIIKEDEPTTYISDCGEDDVICLGAPGQPQPSSSPSKTKPSPPKNGFVGTSPDNHEEWCRQNDIPLDYEKKLIGVSYCGTNSHQLFALETRKKWPEQCEEFDKEIWLHYKNNGQCSKVYDWKMQVRDKLFAEFKDVFYNTPKVNLWAVGSTVNGCGSFNSDMDLCLCLPDDSLDNPYFTEKSKCLRVLRQVQNALNKRPAMRQIVRHTEVISQAKLDLDINVNNVAGVYNSHLIHYYSKVDVRFPSICLLVKHWAIINEISDAMNGTFNSYSLILMVLHYLQCGVKPAVLPNLQHLMPELFSTETELEHLELHGELEGLPERPLNNMKIGDLMVGFFAYYRNFDFETWAMSVRSGRRFLRSDLENGNTNYYIFIEEPFDLINTARCVREPHNFESIKKAFRTTCQALSKRGPQLKNIGVTL